MKKYLFILALLLLPLGLAWAVTVSPSSYDLLEPALLPDGSPEHMDSFSGFLALLFKTFLTLSILVAVVSVIMAGIKYITSNTPLGKYSGKNWMGSAIAGLILALAAYAILNTINPKILQWELLQNNAPESTPAR